MSFVESIKYGVLVIKDKPIDVILWGLIIIIILGICGLLPIVGAILAMFLLPAILRKYAESLGLTIGSMDVKLARKYALYAFTIPLLVMHIGLLIVGFSAIKGLYEYILTGGKMGIESITGLLLVIGSGLIVVLVGAAVTSILQLLYLYPFFANIIGNRVEGAKVVKSLIMMIVGFVVGLIWVIIGNIVAIIPSIGGILSIVVSIIGVGATTAALLKYATY